MSAPSFLVARKARPLTLVAGGLSATGYHLGHDPKHNTALEVVVATATTEPKATSVRTLWKQRHDGRPAPLVVVVIRPDGRVHVAGPLALKDDPAVSEPLELALVEQVCKEALDQPDKESALRYLRDALPAVQSDTPGLRNEGFLANYTVANLPRSLDKWSDLNRRAKSLVGQTDAALLRGLGFDLSPLDNLSSLLKATASGSRTAVAVVLQPDESPDLEAARFNGISPVTYAMQKAVAESLRYVLVCQGPRVRLYSAEPQVGVASRSRTETFVELHSGLLTGDRAGYLLALLSDEALEEGGYFDQALTSSKLYAAEVAKKLRERVYDRVIPALAKGLAEARKIKKPTANDLAATYGMAMQVLFRLLFIAYAEDKGLLPSAAHGLYQRRSLKHIALDLQQLHRGGTPFDPDPSLWNEVAAIAHAVGYGKREWGIPAYGGELFAADEHPMNAALDRISLPNTVFGPALQSLLLTDTEHGLAPIDFKTLGVREFGTIYEGLLESELAVAEADLTTDAEGNYRPVKGKEKPVVRKGAIYLHNKSGQRKASGTYFTKPFAVDHLLDEALEPALKDHIARLDGLKETEAAEAFFDFRCADIAMGSAHFLVAAVDRIERALSGYLTRRPLPLVAKELDDLRAAAEGELGQFADAIDPEKKSSAQMLRRQIARRCIYGVDLNPVAVTLARLSIWIHTFVPGLPLSFLNHNLVCGNSLVGIGQVDEIAATFHETDTSGLFKLDAKKLVGDALEPLTRMAAVVDRTSADIKRMKAALDEAEKAVAPAKAVCDIATACRITGTDFPTQLLDDWETQKGKIVGSEVHCEALAALAHLPPFHFPVAFPEVLLRDRAGFDVLLGNPPWEKARVEEHAFWGRHVPRLRGMNKPDREAAIAALSSERNDLVRELELEQAQSKQFRDAIRDMPGMNTGHPDLFRAFLWRFTQLIHRCNGQLGIVLPGDAFKIAGAADLRETLAAICGQVRVQMLTNKAEWVFDDVDGRKLIAFVTASALEGAGLPHYERLTG